MSKKSKCVYRNQEQPAEEHTFYLHELVALVHVPNPNNYTKVRHKNGKRNICDISQIFL